MTDPGLLSYFSTEPGIYFSYPLLWFGLLIVLCATIAVSLLFFYGKKDKFYPAMPFISAGCIAGYFLGLVILLIRTWVF